MEQQRGSDKHGPRVDEQQKHETQGIVQGQSDGRAQEYRQPEPTGDAPGEGGLGGTARPEGHEPGSPEGLSPDEVDSRSDLARWISGVHAFPADKKELVERAQEQFAPDSVLSALRSLPERRYDNMNDVAKELGIAGRGQFD
ncbi:DUF2795 domain-containing protein [Nonomuraea sp. NPDC048826]|uniref:DUF2795 domain-containing protein n=1 Tax=Nonomuraea sp. NPDC048826 TaxID=3364347 RepID=UPI003718D9B8